MTALELQVLLEVENGEYNSFQELRQAISGGRHHRAKLAFEWLVANGCIEIAGDQHQISRWGAATLQVATCKPVQVAASLHSFGELPFETVKEIQIVIERIDTDNWVATFYDAGVSASGCNQVEAFNNCREMIAHSFEYLSSLDHDKIGPALRQRLVILREYMKPRAK